MQDIGRDAHEFGFFLKNVSIEAGNLTDWGMNWESYWVWEAKKEKK